MEAIRGFFDSKAKIIQVDINATNLGKRSPIDIGVVGDVAATLEQLTPLLKQREKSDHLDRALENWKADRKDYKEHAEERDPSLIHPQFLTQTLDRLAADDAIFTADGGSPMVWLLRHLTANGRRRFLTSLMHCTMANAYPQALGIARAYPDRQVVALCGDGGLSMLMCDLLTLKQDAIPVKLLVFNNGSLGFVEMEQRVEGLLDAFTELENPDFGALARACGLHGASIETVDELEPAMREWFDHKGPALLDVPVNRLELVMPPEIEAGQVASTAMFGLKTVLNGRISEVVSLLRDNFIR